MGNPATPNLALVSSNFLQSASGSQVFQEWVGAVKNLGSSTVCSVSVSASFEDASGAVIVTPSTAYIDADPYLASGSTVTTSCLAPGETRGFYTNGFANSDVAISSTAKIAIQFAPFPLASGEVPAAGAPTVSAQIVPYLGGYAVGGTLTAGASAASAVILTFYPVDATGLVLGQSTASDPSALAAGGTWSFTSDVIDTSFTSYLQSMRFISGTTAAIAEAVPADGARAAADAAQRRAGAENAARARLAKH